MVIFSVQSPEGKIPETGFGTMVEAKSYCQQPAFLKQAEQCISVALFHNATFSLRFTVLSSYQKWKSILK